MGLLLGASVLTVFELLDLLFFNLILKMKEAAQRKQKKSGPQNYTENGTAQNNPDFEDLESHNTNGGNKYATVESNLGDTFGGNPQRV